MPAEMGPAKLVAGPLAHGALGKWSAEIKREKSLLTFLEK